MMKDWANWALDTAKRRGASYADVRVMDTGMTALPAAAATVTIIIKSENLSRMMASFCLAVLPQSDFPHELQTDADGSDFRHCLR